RGTSDLVSRRARRDRSPGLHVGQPGESREGRARRSRVTVTAPRPLRIETPRLLLHPLARQHEAAFHAINIDPAVGRSLCDGRAISPAASPELLSRSLALLEGEGYGLFGVSLRGEDALAGWAGYLHSHQPPVLEIAYALLPRYWGRGLAVEAT